MKVYIYCRKCGKYIEWTLDEGPHKSIDGFNLCDECWEEENEEIQDDTGRSTDRS